MEPKKERKMPNPLSSYVTKYIYIRDVRGTPVACLAWRRHATRVTFGISTHNPIEKFSRVRAKFIAEERRIKHMRSVATTSHSSTNDSIVAIMRRIVNDCETPSRTKRAARHMIKVYNDRKFMTSTAASPVTKKPTAATSSTAKKPTAATSSTAKKPTAAAPTRKRKVTPRTSPCHR